MPKTRQQRRAQVRRPPVSKRRGGIAFVAFILILLLGGGFAAATFRSNPPPLTRGAMPGEHWHAAYRVYVCGQRLTNFPSLEGEIHTHGDPFIHIHPVSEAASGENANLGAFFRHYETFLGQGPDGQRVLAFPDGTSYSDGDTCPDGDGPHDIELLVNGEPVTGDPAAFIPHDGDEVVLRFGPQGEEPMPNPYSVLMGIPDQPPVPGPAPEPDETEPVSD